MQNSKKSGRKERVHEGENGIYYFNGFDFKRLCDCPEGGSSNPGVGSLMSIVARELE